MSILLTGCSGGSFSLSENSYVSGEGVVTSITKADRKSAPVISGKSISGANIAIKNGRIALVNVWASWCAPCRAEAPILQELTKEFPEVQFVGLLTRDSKENANAFLDRFKITYPTMADDAILLDFQKSLPVGAIPTTFLIDKEGKVAARVLGEITYSSISKLLNDLAKE